MKPDVCFVTVCGGGDDYEFLLGSIDHHASIGNHFVLDTTPLDDAKTFKLPKTVLWEHRPIYGRGWKDFMLRTALEDALRLAKQYMMPQVLAVLDCDEFYTADDWPFQLAVDRMVEVKTVTWKPDGVAYDMGDSEWHRRLWPASMDVKMLRNEAWLVHPQYNGNPEHHPIAAPPSEGEVVRAVGPVHHHVHYAIGRKASETETADTTIDGWKSGGTLIDSVPWPAALAKWKSDGIPPSLLL